MPDSTQALFFNNKVYRGIKSRVSFGGDLPPSEVDEGNLNQLSGGQKTVVVIAMIFAVLRMEAAPFYILDEFDHALDAQYRHGIASLVAELALKSQFMITTFKPELVKEVLDASICEVKFANRKSTVCKIDKARALEIINGV